MFIITFFLGVMHLKWMKVMRLLGNHLYAGKYI